MCFLANQWVQFSVSTPAQKAVADMLAEAEKPYELFPNYYSYLLDTYTKKLNVLLEATKQSGLIPLGVEVCFFIQIYVYNVGIIFSLVRHQ